MKYAITMRDPHKGEPYTLVSEDMMPEVHEECVKFFKAAGFDVISSGPVDETATLPAEATI